MSQENLGGVRGVRSSLAVSRQRRSRSWDERILVRWPRVSRLSFALWSKLPPRSRLRRALLARNVCRGIAAANRRDFDLLFLSLDPDIEYENFIEDGSGALFPDLIGVQRGHAGYRGIWAAADEAWDDVRVEHHEVIDLGDQLIAHGRITGRARHTGIPIDQPISQLYTLRRGLVVRQHDFHDPDRALEAARLST
jgi:ketosteroid isomerase-like protein